MEGHNKETITIKKETIWKFSTFVLSAILIILLIYMFAGNFDFKKSPSVKIDIGEAPVKGSAKAKVTVVEYSDYECPFCGRHYQQTYPSIIRDYVDTGKVKLAWKDFPLSFHPNAQKAAESARCVREQLGDDGYWQMHDKLFINQNSLSVANEKIWARELGVDGNKFDSCLDSGKYAADIQKDAADGSRNGVQGTPAFLVNGKLISGACPYSTFQQVFDAELAGKKWSVTNCQVQLL